MQLFFQKFIDDSKKVLKTLLPLDKLVQTVLKPINQLLVLFRRKKCHPNSVLHISYLVHIPHHTVELLRKAGMKADYLALGTSTTWHSCDYQFVPHGGLGFCRALQEFLWFWKVVAQYEVIHMHFMLGLSSSGWELPLLKHLGRKIVVHYRGCEIRDREKNMLLHPKMNICQKCDYNASVCQGKVNKQRRALANKYGDLFLVTTPDMLDFVPHAHVMPFFTPEISFVNVAEKRADITTWKIFHATSHPGIEGTGEIQQAIENLRQKGYHLDFVFAQGLKHEEVLQMCATADISIGKMKMGHYANAQIESMALGVPTITYLRPEFVTKELTDSGFIICSLEQLESTLEFYLSHPEQLAKKRQLARESILNIHDNQKLIDKLAGYYKSLKMPEGKTYGI